MAGRQNKHHKAVSPRKYIKFLFGIVFIFYLFYVISLVFLDDSRLMYWDYSGPMRYNLHPFKTIKSYIHHYDQYNFDTWFKNLFGNVMLFMPLGFLVPLIFDKTNHWFKILVISFLSSSMIEVTQIYFRLGGFDVDDIILNTTGGIIGFIVWAIVYHLLTRRRITRYLFFTS